MGTFDDHVATVTTERLHADDIQTIQVSVGAVCNQACAHCHVQASPERAEVMQWPTMEMVRGAARSVGHPLVDLTGGAPELNPDLRRFVAALREDGHPVQVRTNLTVLHENGMEDMPEFFRRWGVRLVASMPCYLEENVAAQRGPRVYEKSIEAIRRLNALGYGHEPGLQLNLVYNPGGPFLPPDQSALEADYRRELGGRFGVEFTRLLTIANMPIGRFGDQLRREHKEQDYMELLVSSFNPDTVDGLMCRHQISVGWDGTLYDCDFNLVLDMPVGFGAPGHVSDFDVARLARREIVTGEHCFGCTAGCGSSCAGALA